MEREIFAVITAITGEQIIIGKNELKKSINKHFPFLSDSALLKLVEMVLTDPSEVFLEEVHESMQYRFFYRFQNERYLVVVVKKIKTENFFCSAYKTGKKLRNKHKIHKRIWLK